MSNNIIALSEQYRVGAFVPQINFAGDAAVTNAQHISTGQVTVLRCPSYAGSDDCRSVRLPVIELLMMVGLLLSL